MSHSHCLIASQHVNAPRKLNLSFVLFSSTSHFKTTMIDNPRISHLNVRAFNDQEANIAFLKEALMQMEQNIVSQEVKIIRNKAQFKATKVKDK